MASKSKGDVLDIARGITEMYRLLGDDEKDSPKLALKTAQKLGVKLGENVSEARHLLMQLSLTLREVKTEQDREKEDEESVAQPEKEKKKTTLVEKTGVDFFELVRALKEDISEYVQRKDNKIILNFECYNYASQEYTEKDLLAFDKALAKVDESLNYLQLLLWRERGALWRELKIRFVNAGKTGWIQYIKTKPGAPSPQTIGRWIRFSELCDVFPMIVCLKRYSFSALAPHMDKFYEISKIDPDLFALLSVNELRDDIIEGETSNSYYGQVHPQRGITIAKERKKEFQTFLSKEIALYNSDLQKADAVATKNFSSDKLTNWEDVCDSNRIEVYYRLLKTEKKPDEIIDAPFDGTEPSYGKIAQADCDPMDGILYLSLYKLAQFILKSRDDDEVWTFLSHFGKTANPRHLEVHFGTAVQQVKVQRKRMKKQAEQKAEESAEFLKAEVAEEEKILNIILTDEETELCKSFVVWKEVVGPIHMRKWYKLAKYFRFKDVKPYIENPFRVQLTDFSSAATIECDSGDAVFYLSLWKLFEHITGSEDQDQNWTFGIAFRQGIRVATFKSQFSDAIQRLDESKQDLKFRPPTPEEDSDLESALERAADEAEEKSSSDWSDSPPKRNKLTDDEIYDLFFEEGIKILSPYKEWSNEKERAKRLGSLWENLTSAEKSLWTKTSDESTEIRRKIIARDFRVEDLSKFKTLDTSKFT